MAQPIKKSKNRGHRTPIAIRPSFKPSYFWQQFKGWWHAKLWHKCIIIICVLVFLCISSMYGIAQWYIVKHSHEPLTLGATFIPEYANQLELDPHDTLNAMLADLRVRSLRLVSYWEDIEKNPGTYDFSQLDWQFALAQQYGARVSLSIGLRQPRWPECHMPDWALNEPKSQWQPALNSFITAVVNHYKTSPILDSYQLENEYFLKAFGECKDFDRQRLVSEYNLVKQLDPRRTLVVSMSNNAIGTPIGQPIPDEWAISVYKRVWDKTITERYFEYPIPAWYYAFRAGFTELTRRHDSFIHELQAEAWTPDGYDIATAPVGELYKSLNPQRLQDRFRYGEATGMRQIYLWGGEWWYQMKVKRGEPALWDTARAEFQRANQINQGLDY